MNILWNTRRLFQVWYNIATKLKSFKFELLLSTVKLKAFLKRVTVSIPWVFWVTKPVIIIVKHIWRLINTSLAGNRTSCFVLYSTSIFLRLFFSTLVRGTRWTMYVQRYLVGRFRNHCCHGNICILLLLAQM